MTQTRGAACACAPLCPGRAPWGCAGALWGCRSGTKGCPQAWAGRGPPAKGDTPVPTPPGNPARGGGSSGGSRGGLTYSSMLMGQESGTAAAGRRDQKAHGEGGSGGAGTRGHGDMHTSQQTGSPRGLGGLTACKRGRGAAAGHRERGPHAWSLPGFRAKGTEGRTCWGWGAAGSPHASLRLQGPSSGSALQLGQGDGRAQLVACVPPPNPSEAAWCP